MENYENQWDKLLQIQTVGRDARNADEYHHPYEPTDYRVLERLAERGFLGENDVLLDYGCGKGRVGFFLSYRTKAKTIGIEYDEDGLQHMIVNGMDVTGDIRTPEISMKASQVAAHGVVREVLLDMQRDVAKTHNVIMDGRDIGTVVLPDADVKIFLTASAEVRAQRRTDELLAKGQKADFKKVLDEIIKRDYQDSHREIAPLKQARDAIKLDTSDLDIDGVIAAIRQIVQEKVGV